MKIIQKLKTLGITVEEQADELVSLTIDGGLLFEVLVEEFNEDNLSKAIVKEIELHLECIETENESYFDDCNEEYLKGEWRLLLLNIMEVIK